jgi:hypothetical protein
MDDEDMEAVRAGGCPGVVAAGVRQW